MRYTVRHLTEFEFDNGVVAIPATHKYAVMYGGAICKRFWTMAEAQECADELNGDE